MGILDDGYYRRPFVPADDVGSAINESQGIAGGLEQAGLQSQMMRQNITMQGQQMRMQQQQMDLQDQQISPELEAIFVKTATDLGRPDIAAKYSRGGQQAIPNQTGMAGPASTLTPYIGPGSDVQRTAVQMPQPMGGPKPDAMTNRRFGQFMQHAGPIADDIRTQGNQREIANTYATQRADAAAKRDKLGWANLEAKELMHAMDVDIKTGNLNQKARHNAAQIELGYAKIRNQMERWSSLSTKDRIKVLEDMKGEMGQIRNSIADLGKDPASLIVNEKLNSYVMAQQQRLEELQRLHDQLRDSIASSPSPEVQEGERSSGPAGVQPPIQAPTPVKPSTVKKSRVGEVVDIGGGRKGTITGWNAKLKKWDVKPNK